MATRELTLEERLTAFAQRWQSYSNSEQSGAQSFLHHLLECYGVLDYAPGAIFEQHPVFTGTADSPPELFTDAPSRKPRKRYQTAERMDMYIPKVCVWEMKAPGASLERHYDQVLRYWSLTLPRYMVLCNFQEFWIFDTDKDGGQHLNQAHRLTLADLPANPEALAFLRGEEAHFATRTQEVTRDAAAFIGRIVRDLIRSSKEPLRDRPRITKFALECVFAKFSEDAGLVPFAPFIRAMKRAQESGDLSPVYSLFDDFGRASEVDRQHGVPYINGPLFDREHPKLALDKELLASLYAAMDFKWSQVRPEIFGSIFEKALEEDVRHELGAHFTHETDIMRIVGPTVVRPWRERIAACKTHKECEELVERVKHYHILDPACGSGNFLYVAYREMKRLEAALRNKHQELYYHKVSESKRNMIPPPPGPYFTIHQLHGIDKLDEAVQLTRVVLWIGEHLANLELNLGESTLPLRDLSDTIICADALLAEKGGLPPRGPDDQRAAWFRPPDDGVSELAIVGNPPFMGRHKMRLELTDAYVERLHAAYPDNRNGDLVTYWYPQALETLRPGERAGFVSTNSIAQNESREASLDRIVAEGGTIYDAWKSYPWPGESAVHVSIVNWLMGKYEGLMRLQDNATTSISTRLSNEPDTSAVGQLASNGGLSFKGVEPGVTEFIVDEIQRRAIVQKDATSARVIVPYLIGRDLNRRQDQTPARWIINFTFMGLDEAKRFTGAFRYAQEHIYPAKTQDLRKGTREKERWWLYRTEVLEMQHILQGTPTFLVCARVSPHVMFFFAHKPTLPSSDLIAVAFDSHYHFGVLQSRIHEVWAWARGSTLEERLRYTNTTIFETFPFPLHPKTWPRARQVKGIPGPKDLYEPREVPDTREAARVSKIAEELYAKRQAACKALNLGLTKLYNFIKGKTKLSLLGAEHQARVKELIALHEQLSDAVNACYGWPLGAWRDDGEVLTRLLELNRQLTS